MSVVELSDRKRLLLIRCSSVAGGIGSAPNLYLHFYRSEFPSSDCCLSIFRRDEEVILSGDRGLVSPSGTLDHIPLHCGHKPRSSAMASR